MVVDLRQSVKKDVELVQTCLFPHLLAFSLMHIPKDGDEKNVSYEWVKVLGQESVAPLAELPRIRQRKLARRVEAVGRKVLDESGPADSFKEVALAVSLALLELIRIGRILDINNQYSTIAIKISEEALDYGDWGSMDRAKDASNSIIRELYDNNCFRKDMREVEDGSSIIT